MTSTVSSTSTSVRPAIIALLYCVEDVDPKVIDNLLYQSQHPKDHANCWSLVCTPSQTTIDRPTHVPVDAFKTGFKDFSIEQLADYTKLHPAHKESTPAGVAQLCSSIFGILDARSGKDGTMQVVTYHNFIEHDPENESKTNEHDEWVTLRVKFEESSACVQTAEGAFMFLFEEYPSDEERIDENGVFNVPMVEMRSKEDIARLEDP